MSLLTTPPATIISSLLAVSLLLAGSNSFAEGLELKDKNTPAVHFVYNDQPVLSFGTMSDWTFYLSGAGHNFTQWVDWQDQNGMNHLRAGVTDSWIFVEEAMSDNGASGADALFPFEQVDGSTVGARMFDLSKFDAAYWAAFRSKLDYLQSKGVIVHLMMAHGLRLSGSQSKHWGGHFFNPDNNINNLDGYLGGASANRLKFWHSYSDRGSNSDAQALWDLQVALWEKIVIETRDYNNVYYDLVTELGENYDDSQWTKVLAWVNAMSNVVRNKWQETNLDREIILGMDAGSLDDDVYRFITDELPVVGSETRDILDNTNFDVIVWGNVHTPSTMRLWREVFVKPVIPQESIDRIGQTDQKWTYRQPEVRVQIRKYIWKMMMAKAQQIDVYAKNYYAEGYPEPTVDEHNYNPNGHSAFEDDAQLLRTFWNKIENYPTLMFSGDITNAPQSVGGTQPITAVLSSADEALLYLSAPVTYDASPNTFESGIQFNNSTITVESLDLGDGAYDVEVFDPGSGTVASSTQSLQVTMGQLQLELPAFQDDLAVHLKRNDGCIQGPYGQVFSINQRIEAEEYDTCGEGVAYHDLGPENFKDVFRTDESVDIAIAQDEGGGYNIGEAQAGEWVEYTVDIPQAGTYEIEVRVASKTTGQHFHIEFGENQTNPIAMPDTGDWQVWETISGGTVDLSEGTQVMRLVLDGVVGTIIGNFNWIKIVPATTAVQAPYNPTPFSVGMKIEAEEYDLGGAGVAYMDLGPTNEKTDFRQSEGVDVADTSDVGGGHNLADTEETEWVEYTLDIAASGLYDIEARVATPNSGRNIRIEFDDEDKTGLVETTNTGGWQIWDDQLIKSAVSLSQGQQVMKVGMEGPGIGANFNWFRINETSQVYQQSANGLVVIETENYHLNEPEGQHEWNSSEIPSGSSGSAMRTNPNIGGVGGRFYTNFATDAPQLDYRVNFVNAGVHHIWVRAHANGEGGDDSLNAGINNSAPNSNNIKYFSTNVWLWSKDRPDGPATIDVPSTGVHTINLWPREDGINVDKIVITPDANYDPATVNNGLGPDESVLSN